PLPAGPPRTVPGVPAGLGRELAAARRLGRRRHGPARARRDDVAGRAHRRPAPARRRPADRTLPGPVPEPADLGPPRLRDDAPPGAGLPGGDPGRVLLV